MEEKKATISANSNIAIIKYWGKRDEVLNLPMNSSLSFTMDEQLSTTTTVEFDNNLKKDEANLDGKAANNQEYSRVSKFLDIIRLKTKIKTYAKVVSRNSFPKGVGLASSASGFAALAGAATKAAGLDLPLKELSIIARLGSGSASRSIFGGAVLWYKGSRDDGTDSYAVQLSDEKNWKQLRNIIAIVDPNEKKVSSRAGMVDTVKTSSLFKKRLIDVEKRLELVKAAIKNNNFNVMIDTIIEDSDSMHSCIADTKPSITYLNETSRAIMNAVRKLNETEKIAAYTFDAGPNANIYTTEKHAQEVKGILSGVPGVQRIIECKIGQGIRFSDKHLF